MSDPVEDFFAHHGVKGMRWGVRKRRSGGGGSGPKKSAPPKAEAPSKPSGHQTTNHTESPVHKQASKQTPGKTTHTPSDRLSPHEVKKLTDQELKDRISRIELEKKYAQLTAPQMSPGKKAVQQILANTAKNTGQSVLNSISAHYVDQLMSAAGFKPMKNADSTKAGEAAVNKTLKKPIPGQLAITR